MALRHPTGPGTSGWVGGWRGPGVRLTSEFPAVVRHAPPLPVRRGENRLHSPWRPRAPDYLPVASWQNTCHVHHVYVYHESIDILANNHPGGLRHDRYPDAATPPSHPPPSRGP